MRILIVDDERAARGRLRRLLCKFPFVECADEAADGVSALQMIPALKPDLLLLDIHMPMMSGLELLQHTPEESRPFVIFTTGYNEYALEAFDRHAVGYLLKPVDVDKLSIALERVEKLLRSETAKAEEGEHTHAVAKALRPPQLLVGKRQNRFYLLRPQKVLWIAIEGGVAKAFTQGESFWLTQTLNELETQLKPLHFFRARRDLLVNLAGVHSIRPFDRSSFLLVMGDVNQIELVVSERQAKHLRQMLPGL